MFKNRSENWKSMLLDSKKEFHSDINCEEPNERNLQLYKKLHLSGTPAIIFSDNSRLAGYHVAEHIEKSLEK